MNTQRWQQRMERADQHFYDPGQTFLFEFTYRRDLYPGVDR